MSVRMLRMAQRCASPALVAGLLLAGPTAFGQNLIYLRTGDTAVDLQTRASGIEIAAELGMSNYVEFDDVTAARTWASTSSGADVLIAHGSWNASTNRYTGNVQMRGLGQAPVEISGSSLAGGSILRAWYCGAVQGWGIMTSDIKVGIAAQFSIPFGYDGQAGREWFRAKLAQRPPGVPYLSRWGYWGTSMAYADYTYAQVVYLSYPAGGNGFDPDMSPYPAGYIPQIPTP